MQWEHPALTYWRSLLYDLLALEPAHVAGEAARLCGTQPPRGLGPFAHRHAPRVPDQAHRAASSLSASLGQLAEAFWLAAPTGLVFHIGLAAQAKHVDLRRR